MKPNILVCATTPDQSNEILWDFLLDDLPNLENDDAKQEDDKNGSQDLVLQIIETPVANFILSNEISDYEPNDFEGLTMPDYVKKVEAELKAKKLPNGAPGKVDLVWYIYTTITSGGEAERDFIRSAAMLPNALIIFDNMSLDRIELKKDIEEITGFAGSRRLVVKEPIATSHGARILAERMKDMYLDRADGTAKEKKAYAAAWKKFFGEKIEEWKEEEENDVGEIIAHAAGHANFILAKPSNLGLNELIEEGVFLLGELVEILKGGEPEARTGKMKLAHAAELKDNIVNMIYEIAACYGVAPGKFDVESILRFAKAGVLPKNAAAVTYAAGKVARAAFIQGVEYTEDEVQEIAREAKMEAMSMRFRPYDYDNSTGIDEDDEDDDCCCDPLQDALDELPEDARGDVAPADDAGKGKKAGKAKKAEKSDKSRK